MTPNVKAYQCSIGMHLLVVTLVIFLSGNMDVPSQVVRINFALLETSSTSYLGKDASDKIAPTMTSAVAVPSDKLKNRETIHQGSQVAITEKTPDQLYENFQTPSALQPSAGQPESFPIQRSAGAVVGANVHPIPTEARSDQTGISTNPSSLSPAGPGQVGTHPLTQQHINGSRDGKTSNSPGGGDMGTQADRVGKASPIASINSQKLRKDSYLREEFEYIRQKILGRLTYPLMAKRMGWTGQVVVAFTIMESGRVEGFRIITSSGFDLLDADAVETVNKSSPFPQPPVRAEIVMPITYQLN